MAQRVNIAIAMLGEPKHLILDEPVNGLDPEGIAWIRQTCRNYANQGRAVLISSHLLSELENTIDRAVVIGKGEKLADGTLNELLQMTGEKTLEQAYFNLTMTSVEFQAQFPDLPSIVDHSGSVPPPATATALVPPPTIATTETEKTTAVAATTNEQTQQSHIYESPEVSVTDTVLVPPPPEAPAGQHLVDKAEYQEFLKWKATQK